MNHIIWDFNGTLLADAQLGVDADNFVFDALGLPRITMEDYRNHMTMPVRNFYSALGVDLNIYKYETISRIWLDYFNQHAVDAGLVPGAADLIARMKALGYTQSILSASYEPSLLEQCRALGLSGLIDEISGLADESAMKKTDIGREQMKKLGLSGSETVLVGDMLADAELAQALGTQCVLVPWGHNSTGLLRTAGCAMAGTIEELENILTQMYTKA